MELLGKSTNMREIRESLLETKLVSLILCPHPNSPQLWGQQGFNAHDVLETLNQCFRYSISKQILYRNMTSENRHSGKWSPTQNANSLLVIQCSAGRRRFFSRPWSTERTDGRCTNCSTNKCDWKKTHCVTRRTKPCHGKYTAQHCCVLLWDTWLP